MARLVLGSASPRRKELLAQINPDYQVRVSHADERCTLADPKVRAMYTAGQKAMDIPIKEDEVLVCADTIVYCLGRILGKPKDASEARDMLELLNHNLNQVYTGVCLRTHSSWDFFVATSDVRIDMSEQEIEAYIATGSPMDKAGAYGIQDDGLRVTLVSGSLSNVIGLPIEDLEKRLAAYRV